MTKDVQLANVRAVRAELLQLLDGMDYCLDWKPDPSSWSVREVVYHLLDTPLGGIHSVLRGTLAGELTEFDVWADLTNMTPERQANDMGQVLEDLDGLFQGMEKALEAASSEELAGKPVLVHLRNRGRDEPRTVQALLEGLFARHWRDHLGQIKELRESLGV
jgi:hypothetical protein